jgi:hypothetical protein
VTNAKIKSELSFILSSELHALSDLLSPVLQDIASCKSAFRAMGFCADVEFDSLLRQSHLGLGEECALEIEDVDPDRLELADIIEVYPNRMLQFIQGRPTPRVRYMSCLGRKVRERYGIAFFDALKSEQIVFANEANRLPEALYADFKRKSIIEKIFFESLVNTKFSSIPVMTKSAMAWHPLPTWIDAGVRIRQCDTFDIILLAETPRPLKFKKVSILRQEPNLRDTLFDQVEISCWAIPKRDISNLKSCAIKIKQTLFYYYRNFYSAKGLQRIVEARVAELTIMLR